MGQRQWWGESWSHCRYVTMKVKEDQSVAFFIVLTHVGPIGPITNETQPEHTIGVRCVEVESKSNNLQCTFVDSD